MADDAPDGGPEKGRQKGSQEGSKEGRCRGSTRNAQGRGARGHPRRGVGSHREEEEIKRQEERR